MEEMENDDTVEKVSGLTDTGTSRYWIFMHVFENGHLWQWLLFFTLFAQLFCLSDCGNNVVSCYIWHLWLYTQTKTQQTFKY